MKSSLLSTQAYKGLDCFIRTLTGLIQKTSDISGVGICTAGIVDSQKGKILGGIENIPYLKGVELRSILQDATGKQIEILNDVSAVALGENWVGAARGCPNFFCITIGTGIGGGLMLDGKLFEGSNFHAGEIGYMNYSTNGNCLETGCSAKALLGLASEVFGESPITPNLFFDRVASSEPKATVLYRQWIDGLAKALANALLIIDPEKLIVGGGITERGELLRKPLEEAIYKHLPEEMNGHWTIELAECGNNAGMLGAVRYFVTRTGR